MINKQKIKYITQRAILTGTLSLTLLSGKTINTNAHEIKSNYSNFYEVDEENDKKIVNIPEKFKKIITDEIGKSDNDNVTISDLNNFNPVYYFNIDVDENDDLSWLNYCNNLLTLTITFENCNSLNPLKKINELRSLEHLILINNNNDGLDFTNTDAINFIKESNSIKILSLSGFNIEPGILENLKNLERLSIGNGKDMNVDYSELTFLSSLEITDGPYTAATYITNGDISVLQKNGVSISGTTDDFLEKLENVNFKIDKIVQSLDIKETDSEQEKLNKILIYVLENCIYDSDVKNNTSDDILSFYEGGKLYGALEKDTQICGNYSALVCALCKRVNLKANYIVDNNHAWNLVKINNQEYFVDSTWLDDEYFVTQTKMQDPEGNSNDYIYKKVSALDLLKSKDYDSLKMTWYMVDPYNFSYIDQNGTHITNNIPSYIKVTPTLKENGNQNDNTVVIEIKDKNQHKVFQISIMILIGILAGIPTGIIVKNKIVNKEKIKVKTLKNSRD